MITATAFSETRTVNELNQENELLKMLTVTELARQTGSTQHAVRYYTRMGLLRPVRNPNNDYRLYHKREINWLKFVQQAKQLGYTLNEIKEIMHDADHQQSPCPRVREILQTRIEENRLKLEQLIVLQNRMEQALQQWESLPDGIPDGHSVCHLIESFTDQDTSNN